MWVICPTSDKRVKVEHLISKRTYKPIALRFWVRVWRLSCKCSCSSLDVIGPLVIQRYYCHGVLWDIFVLKSGWIGIIRFERSLCSVKKITVICDLFQCIVSNLLWLCSVILMFFKQKLYVGVKKTYYVNKY